MATELVQCPTCHKVADTAEALQAKCGSFITCAKRAVPIEPSVDVVVGCANCSCLVAVSASDILSGKSLQIGGLCQRAKDSCMATVVTYPFPTSTDDGTSDISKVARAPRGKSAKS